MARCEQEMDQYMDFLKILDSVLAIFTRHPVIGSILYWALALVIWYALLISPSHRERRDSISQSTSQIAIGWNATTVIIDGMKINQLATSSPVIDPAARSAVSAEVLIYDGGFERGLDFWGTGWFEDHFEGFRRAPLSFNGALAKWYVDTGASKAGTRSLRVEHDSEYSPHVYSTLSQKVALKPFHRYEVSFWARPVSAKGGLVLRVLPSRRHPVSEWDRYKVKTAQAELGKWSQFNLPFETHEDRFYDVRFFAEGPVRAWIDEVEMRDLGEVPLK